MKILIIYDSFFGNTEKVAQEIKRELNEKHEVVCKKVDDFTSQDLEGVSILFIGSPTRAFSSSEKTKLFLESLEEQSLEKIEFILFDTRADERKVPALVRFMMKSFGYADKHMEKFLIKKGGRFALSSLGFIVEDKEGPLRDGELEKIPVWLQKLN